MLKGHMDEFLIVLVIALALIVVFGFFFSNAPLPTPSENLTITEIEVGRIGFSSSIPAREIPMGRLTAGLQQEETIRDIPVFEISANIFSAGREKYDVSVNKDVLKSLEKILVNFDVTDTNMYSNLVLEWNGEKIFDDKAKGPQNIIVLKEKIKEENVLEVYTLPSGYFWASTVYKIEDLEIKQEYGEARPFPVFISSNEFETLDRGELEFYVGDATSLGELIVKLNGKEIFNNYTRGLVKLKIDQPGKFDPGNNILSFSAKSGIFELHDAKLNLFSIAKTVVKQKNFNLDQSRLDKLKGSLVNFLVDVKYVDKPGTLRIELNNHPIQFDITESGVKTVGFDKLYLQKGDNTIVFSTNGNFEINRIKIIQ